MNDNNDNNNDNNSNNKGTNKYDNDDNKEFSNYERSAKYKHIRYTLYNTKGYIIITLVYIILNPRTQYHCFHVTICQYWLFGNLDFSIRQPTKKMGFDTRSKEQRGQLSAVL